MPERSGVGHLETTKGPTVSTSYFHLNTISLIRNNLTLTLCRCKSCNDSVSLFICRFPRGNNAARVIHRKSGSDHITPVLRQLHWLSIIQRIKHKLMTLAYKAMNCDGWQVYLSRALQWKTSTRQLSPDQEKHIL